MSKRILVIVSILFTLVSCADFLKPTSENEFVPTTIQDLDEMLLYETYARTLTTTNPFFDLLTDDAAVVRFGGTESNLLSSVRLASIKAVFTWQPNIYRAFEEDHLYESQYDAYSSCYSKILGCNAVMDYIGTVEGKEEARIMLTAEALALRAFWYFQLVNIYGQPYSYDPDALGVPLHLQSKVSSASIPRNTVKEVYDQVLKDLKASEKEFLSLPVEKQWRPNLRVSLPFVHLMLSRVYLYMEDWQNASLYASKVIENGNFSLIDKGGFPSAGSYMYFHYYNNPEVIWPFSNSAFFSEFMDPYMIDISKGGKVSFVVADASLLNLFDDKDIRKTHYLVPDKRSTNYKAFGKLALQGGDNSPDSNNKFARSLRLSEAYLNKAEAEAMMFLEGMGEEHKTEAVNLLKIMWSKKIDEVPSSYLDDRTAASLVKTVRNERRRELCFEDHRWFDLRRQGMPKINHKWMGDHSDSQVTTYELTKNDPMYTLQIPENVMVRNDKLIQNPAGPIRVGQ